MAGAVLRATGSSTIARGFTPARAASSSTRKRWSLLQTMIGLAMSGSAAVRCSVAANRQGPWPARARMNCLGYMARDNGHRRVPAPPDKSTG